jgi:hypothetical protein
LKKNVVGVIVKHNARFSEALACSCCTRGVKGTSHGCEVSLPKW